MDVADQLEDLVHRLGAEDLLGVKSALEHAKHGEEGLAIENLCTQLYEFAVPLTQTAYDELHGLANGYGVDPSYFECLAAQVSPAGESM